MTTIITRAVEKPFVDDAKVDARNPAAIEKDMPDAVTLRAMLGSKFQMQVFDRLRRMGMSAPAAARGAADAGTNPMAVTR